MLKKAHFTSTWAKNTYKNVRFWRIKLPKIQFLPLFVTENAPSVVVHVKAALPDSKQPKTADSALFLASSISKKGSFLYSPSPFPTFKRDFRHDFSCLDYYNVCQNEICFVCETNYSINGLLSLRLSSILLPDDRHQLYLPELATEYRRDRICLLLLVV